MIIVPDSHTVPTSSRHLAEARATGHGFATFMAAAAEIPPGGIGPVGPQVARPMPQDDAESANPDTAAEPDAPAGHRPGQPEHPVSQPRGIEHRATATGIVKDAGQAEPAPLEAATAGPGPSSTVPRPGPARGCQVGRTALVPDGQEPSGTSAPPRDTNRADVHSANLPGVPTPETVAEQPPAAASGPRRGVSKAPAPDDLPSGDGSRPATRAAPGLPATGPAAARRFMLTPRNHEADATMPSTGRDPVANLPVKHGFAAPPPPAGAPVNHVISRDTGPAFDLVRIAEPEPDDLVRPTAGAPTASTHQAAPCPLATAQVPQVPAQIVAAINRAAIDGHKTTEVALNPDELGRVRLRLATTDGALTVMVSAERAETMELLRRNIETLARDLEAAGYDGARIIFSQDGGGAGEREAHAPASLPASGKPATGAPDVPAHMLITLGDRLDIRL
jgi:hypothetical protein